MVEGLSGLLDIRINDEPNNVNLKNAKIYFP